MDWMIRLIKRDCFIGFTMASTNGLTIIIFVISPAEQRSRLGYFSGCAIKSAADVKRIRSRTGRVSGKIRSTK